MKNVIFVFAICFLTSCDVIHVAQNKTKANTTSLGIEVNYNDIPNSVYQKQLDSSLTVEIEKFNSEAHAFSVHRKSPRDKDKDYITIDFEKARIVGTGGKIAGYAITTLGLAAPFVLIAVESPIILAFYYFPEHNLTTRVTISPNLSEDRKDHKNLLVNTGALFSSNKKQIPKLMQKYTNGFHKILLDVEKQLAAH